MFSFKPSLDPKIASAHLSQLIASAVSPEPFKNHLRRLRTMFDAYAKTCPAPWPAPGLMVTPEDIYRSELWLPLSSIEPVFRKFYHVALRYTPILSSCPIATASSWSSVVATFPAFCGLSADPSFLLERLLKDSDIRTKFLCWAFMPRRFYGKGSGRYPDQTKYILEFLAKRRGRKVRILETACGDGGGVYQLAGLLLEQGWRPEEFLLRGWSLDPLEIWAAAHIQFPNDPPRENYYKNAFKHILTRDVRNRILFSSKNLADRLTLCSSKEKPEFDLIICNGLLGGPIINESHRLKIIVHNLARLLRPGGLLLAANHFHAGWKKHRSLNETEHVLRECGLRIFIAGEGLGGLKTNKESA